jgi:arabinofuranan 3-O-arabinosyltransferase
LVTVVVPTRQAAHALGACLASIRAQRYEPIELIVVDNSSTDETVAIAEQYADEVITAGPERSAQRNVGIERATGAWVLWIDADMILPPQLVEAMVAAGEEAGADGVFALEESIGDGFWTACRRLERSCYWDETEVQSPRLVRTGWFREHGGFSTDLSGTEDADLRVRMLSSGTLASVRDAILHDEGHITLRSVVRKRFYYGQSLPVLRRRQPGSVGKQAGATLHAYLSNWRRLAADPLHAAGLVVLRGTEILAYLVGAAVAERRIRRHGLASVESTAHVA